MKHTSLIGIDISDSSVKVLELNKKYEITAYGESKLPQGVVQGGSISDTNTFSTTLIEALKHTRPKVLYTEQGMLHAILCLPESKIFSHYLSVPDSVKKSDLELYIQSDAQKIIPFELATMYWDYHVVEKKGGRTATFIGVSKTDLDNYISAFVSAGVQPVFVSGELFSLGNALLPFGQFNDGYLIVDIGKHSTTIGIFSDDAIANLSVKVPMGGDYFTETLSKRLSLSFDEAEALKRQYGLNMEYKDTNIPVVLRECVKEVLNAVIEAKQFFEKKTDTLVTRVILAGGSALLPKIVEFTKEHTGIETEVADPLHKVVNSDVLERDVPGILFANVIGLALSGINTDLTRLNLLTQYRYDDRTTTAVGLKVANVRSFNDVWHLMKSFLSKVRIYLSLGLSYINKLLGKNMKLFLSIVLCVGALLFLFWVVSVYT